MAIKLKLKKGLDLRIAGGIEDKAVKRKIRPQRVSLCPDDFLGITPKPEVKEGSKVKAGEPLFHDKKFEDIKVVSPVSGVLKEIVRGDRRKILQFIIEPEGNEAAKFDTAVKNAEEAKNLLAHSGLWVFMRQLPYGIVPKYDVAPRDIFVSGFDSAPLAPDYSLLLDGKDKELAAGVKLLSMLTKGKVYFTCRSGFKAVPGAEMVEIEGPHPAGNIGVAINHVAPVNKGEVVWTLGAEEVLFIGRLLTTGRVDLTRTVALAGSEVKKPCYAKMLVGQRLDTLLQGQVDLSAGIRIINGNVMTGVKTTAGGYLGAHTTEVNVIPEGDHADEFMGWIMPRFGTFSTHRSYFSWLCGKKDYVFDARVKGGERHMIMSGEYDKVFPMDIYAGYLIKAIITGDIDRQEALGIYEVAPEDFAIAECVDSSKLELQRIVRQGLDILRKENA